MYHGDTSPVPSQRANEPPTTAYVQSENARHGPHAVGAPNMSGEEVRQFRNIYEMQLLPAITEILDRANTGGQVHFHRRMFITILTREEVPQSLQKQIGSVVASTLDDDLRAKVSLEFHVGEVKRSSS